jgi:hypothetical protein
MLVLECRLAVTSSTTGPMPPQYDRPRVDNDEPATMTHPPFQKGEIHYLYNVLGGESRMRTDYFLENEDPCDEGPRLLVWTQ